MEGSIMGQVLHGCATTTHAIRATIQGSQATTAALNRELGFNVKTVDMCSMAARFQVLIWFACTSSIFDNSVNVFSRRIA
jgi:hypothetical protein